MTHLNVWRLAAGLVALSTFVTAHPLFKGVVHATDAELDDSYDYVVIGSGAGGLTPLICFPLVDVVAKIKHFSVWSPIWQSGKTYATSPPGASNGMGNGS